tara:strand:- start:397 stop:633 length:237 start_codon:yes stop_codon:yes gene_type:complete
MNPPNPLMMTSSTLLFSDPHHSHNTMNKEQLIALLRNATNTSDLLARLDQMLLNQQLGATPDQTTGLAAYGRSDEIDF